MLADEAELNRARDWWCESLIFLDDHNGTGFLVGDTKIALLGYSTEDGSYKEVDPDEEELAGWADVNFIVTQLCHWSSQYQIDWNIEVAGESCGQVRNGRPDASLIKYLRAYRESSPLPVSELPRIRRKYADRNEPGYVVAGTTEPPPIHDQFAKPWWRFW